MERRPDISKISGMSPKTVRACEGAQLLCARHGRNVTQRNKADRDPECSVSETRNGAPRARAAGGVAGRTKTGGGDAWTLVTSQDYETLD